MTYTYVVKARDAAGNNSNASASATATAPATAPGAPTGLTATGGDGHVTLSWTAPASNGGAAITNYKIYRATTSGGEGTTPVTTVGNVTTFDDTGLTNGTTYYYKVAAVNSVGTSAQSGEAFATPAVPLPLLTEDFESGTLTGWTATTSFTNSNVNPNGGLRDGQALCTGTPCWAWKAFASSQTATDLWVQTYVYVQTRDTGTTYLLKLRNTSSGSGTSVFGLLLNNKGKLASRNDVTSKTTTSSTVLATGAWHRITIHLTVATAGHVDVWVDGTKNPTLSKNDNFGTVAISKLQLGENATAGNFDVRYDDISVSKTEIIPN
jgi:hypothetical protein